MTVTVLMVAEKPSLAQSIAQILSNGRMSSRRMALEVHEFEGSFYGQRAWYKMTSVIGHVYSLDFTAAYNNWEKTDPATLFDAVPVKSEANPKAHVCRHLQNEGSGCDYLVLWLDCDREGENICFEVMDNVVPRLRKVQGQQVFRAKFSAITAPEIRAAMDNLGEPNRNEALAVDARQELDLKVGVAFTRFQTRFFQGKYGNLDSRVISYGPCQTPTLNFCVERHQAISAFKPEPFWVVRPWVVKAGDRLELEWSRGRLFDQDIATLYLTLVRESRRLRVTEVSEKEDRKVRPPGLNTVEMLKVASQGLNMGPAYTMQIAERLYTSGYISYPRTESSAYPPNFDINSLLVAQRRHSIWGAYVCALMEAGFTPPKGGVDVGDHPPITPMVAATEDEVGGGDAWRLYDLVARSFLASVSPDCVLRKSRAVLNGGGEEFHASGVLVQRQGWTAIMPSRAVQGQPLPPLKEGEQLELKDVELFQGKTGPPDYLSEADLIGLMEKHGIGTDASIPVHINNICERNYVRIEAGRKVVPTELGTLLIRGYQRIDPELCRPQVRSHVEQQLSLIAKGQAIKETVVVHTLEQFRQKFLFFVEKVGRMDALFEATFSPLASSGKPMSKCGKCNRYMNFIASRPSRLYCPACEDIYNVPQGGAIKLYKGLVCPLDNFELLLYSLGGQDGKTYPLCPFCYNYPPFENYAKVNHEGHAVMPCSSCPHPTCPHSLPSRATVPCASCEGGVLLLDPVSGPAWRVDCNKCDFLVYLPPNLHHVKISKHRCEECSCPQLDLEWKKGSSPIEGGSTSYSGCIACDDFLRNMCEVKHGKAFMKRGSGRGRGRRGRGGRGRGRARDKNFDPKMSFRDF